MKVISVISKYPGNGQTTVTVNLAAGLLRKGYRVLIGDWGNNEKLRKWLGITRQPDHGRSKIVSSRLGIDILTVENLLDLSKLEYDYLLFQPASNEDCRLLNNVADVVIACTDFSHANELKELQALESNLQNLEGKVDNISLVLPNKINTKEWEHNSQQLFALADYFGFERIADPIPH